MTEYHQHQQRLERVIMTVNEAIHELHEAREAASEAQAAADPLKHQHASQKLEQAERQAEKARTALLNESGEGTHQQIQQNLQELENAMYSARQF